MNNFQLYHYQNKRAYSENWKPIAIYDVISIDTWSQVEYGVIITTTKNRRIYGKLSDHKDVLKWLSNIYTISEE